LTTVHIAWQIIQPVQLEAKLCHWFAARACHEHRTPVKTLAERAEAAADKNLKTDIGVLLAIGRTYVRHSRGRLLVLLRRHELDRAAILASICDYVEHLLLLCLRNTQ
jgi:hypothetical protein